MKTILGHVRSEAPVEEKAHPEPTDAELGHDGSAISDTDSEGISKDAQPGVQKMEATTTVWTTPHLIAAYVL